MKRILTVAVIALAGCALNGERPDDHVTGRMHWYVDMPDFRMKSVEWNHVSGPDVQRRIAALCGKDGRWLGSSCEIRIRESGMCVVYSRFSEADAYVRLELTGETVRGHALKHCGEGMPRMAGWNHRESVVLTQLRGAR